MNRQNSSILLKNGFVVDGSNAKGFQGDVLIKDGLIEAVSETPIKTEAVVIDLDGKVIAPGFIDAHSHMESILALADRSELKTPFTAQGITTMITGNCGYSAAGVLPGDGRGLHGQVWTTMEDYFTHVEGIGLSHNVIILAGHGTSQMSIRGKDSSPLSQEEKKTLHNLLSEAMDQGAAGISFGLGYEPGIYTPLEDVLGMAELAAKKNKIVTVHGRAYSGIPGDDIPRNAASLLEMIEVSKKSGVRLQYSHLMFAGSASHDTYEKCIDVLDSARSDDVDIMTDTYPYHCGFTFINVFLPGWFLKGLPANYDDPKMVSQVEKTLDRMGEKLGFGYDSIQLMDESHPDFKGFKGLFLDEIAARLDIRPSELVLDLSRKTNGGARILNHNYSNMEIVDALIKHPACLFMTDSLIFPRAFQNPASYGSFPLFLQYARERKLVSVEEMIHRMTGATAERFNIKDRGLLKKGLAADITVFDWDNIRDNNTITETDQVPSGIEAVFINGRQVVESGQVDSSVCAGSVVRI